MADRSELFGCQFHPVTLPAALERVERWISDGGALRQVVGVNLDHLLKCQEDDWFMQVVNRCDLVLADGQPPVWLSRWFAQPRLPERVAVPDLMEAMFTWGDARGWRFFFLGAKEEANKAAVEAVERRFPGLQVAGRHHGYYTQEDEPAIARQITESKADVLLIAITSPKKEAFIDRNRDALQVSIAMGVGGCFDILAGLHSRAPRILRENGLEWTWRAFMEPRRMGRRVIHDLTFGKYVLKRMLRGT